MGGGGAGEEGEELGVGGVVEQDEGEGEVGDGDRQEGRVEAGSFDFGKTRNSGRRGVRSFAVCKCRRWRVDRNGGGQVDQCCVEGLLWRRQLSRPGEETG